MRVDIGSISRIMFHVMILRLNVNGDQWGHWNRVLRLWLISTRWRAVVIIVIAIVANPRAVFGSELECRSWKYIRCVPVGEESWSIFSWSVFRFWAGGLLLDFLWCLWLWWWWPLSRSALLVHWCLIVLFWVSAGILNINQNDQEWPSSGFTSKMSVSIGYN